MDSRTGTEGIYQGVGSISCQADYSQGFVGWDLRGANLVCESSLNYFQPIPPAIR